jgi:hypothetical protein
MTTPPQPGNAEKIDAVMSKYRQDPYNPEAKNMRLRPSVKSALTLCPL